MTISFSVLEKDRPGRTLRQRNGYFAVNSIVW